MATGGAPEGEYWLRFGQAEVGSYRTGRELRQACINVGQNY